MSSAISKELLLSSVISGEVGKLSSKLSFWQADISATQTLWESPNTLSLESVLDSIDPEEDLLESVDLALLYGIGWEFIWGKKPPEVVSLLRQEIIQKVREGTALNELETLWYRLICVDTDMF
ncbi:hypothetical protein A3K29_03670 [Candidatus Collierbacteria bacterium RIFOXYB2_FULL_46_14]|uniref:Uncharacterized protein n=1 Tax=Candidatus Collierbacteria bacterium GW2011_GWA2_46_26 TaxID=1618381 RepID=A0A0G1PIY5_9BACT|nr:MAG: hypothetical protein UW29_C0007G0062 [Candidatus Collierbacteria bacterium GW2011_GWC2_44_13]KKU32711.1 MAG: hypothetical protein UX47_C0008G0068 [Candidatus Collierbacteria bacterium GW2011_GWA2_46_26]OGD73214.1 MAG: hypothetical protein A3K29_03670 [Candidatus Collierbacteria bacterium RIFOXYB2_FULL_46_14]OGD76256.1 MAG: hypothetical protein A3K43_03670 [Candidatus Collierbacteria bacterium RIFOXYA2_FULL_46_20]OGD77592.1 MAG: hypothetical protein A3K39_03670 [Candidatus Collierbacteri